MPKSKSRRIPNAFHSELLEYASLSKAIRTNATLDIVPQLLQAGKTQDEHESTFESTDKEDALEVDEGEEAEVEAGRNVSIDDVSSQPGPSTSTIFAGSAIAAPKRAKGKGEKIQKQSEVTKCITRSTSKRKRTCESDGSGDLWTTWPLLPDECPVPEWTFDEEIAAIAEIALRSRSNLSASSSSPQHPVLVDSAPNSTGDDDGDDIELSISPAHLCGLSYAAAIKLSSLLSALSFHRLNATWIKHKPASPFNWEDILNIAGSSEIFDVKIIEQVQQRMEAIYGPSGSQVVHHMQVLDKSRKALVEAETTFCDYADLPMKKHFHLYTQTSSHPQAKRQKQDNDNSDKVGPTYDDNIDDEDDIPYHDEQEVGDGQDDTHNMCPN